jgi:hypothetical protein
MNAHAAVPEMRTKAAVPKVSTVMLGTKPNSAGYTSTAEHGHNLTPHTSMLPQNHSVTY